MRGGFAIAEIILRDMVKRFGETVAIDHLDLDIRHGEFIVLLGPSGCGKTTTLRCISGLETPDEGHIFLNGEDVTYKKASERDIAFVFQLYALYPHFSVFRNIAFPLITQRHRKEEVSEEVMRAAKMLRIDHLLNKKPKELSGGDQQRVALGRALVRRPKAFLLDEPIGTLDASFREEMRSELKKLHVDVEATTVYVTHDQVEAMSMGDRIAVMNLGVLQQVGTPHEIYSKPVNLFVANFIGSPGMNFLSCETAGQNGSLALRLTELDSLVSIPQRLQEIVVSKSEERKPLVLGVRPENVFMSLNRVDDYLTTEVYALEKMGPYNIIDIKLGNEIVRARTSPEIAPKIKDTVYIGFDMDDVCLFDRESEQSIVA